MSITQNFKKLLDTYPNDKFNQSLVKTIKERLISNSSLQFNTFDDLTRVIGSINLGTPEAPRKQTSEVSHNLTRIFLPNSSTFPKNNPKSVNSKTI